MQLQLQLSVNYFVVALGCFHFPTPQPRRTPRDTYFYTRQANLHRSLTLVLKIYPSIGDSEWFYAKAKAEQYGTFPVLQLVAN